MLCHFFLDSQGEIYISFLKKQVLAISSSLTTLIGQNSQRLYYLLEWENLAERERKWGAFMADPDWLKARVQTEKDGPIVAKVINEILSPTPYSKVH